MAARKCKTILLKKHFEGFLSEDNFEFIEEEISPLVDGEYLVETLYLSVDPYMRTFAKAITQEGTKMFGSGVGRIIESKNSEYPVGAILSSSIGWTTHIKYGKDSPASPFHRVFPSDISPSYALGVFGLNGITAYAGLIEVCNAQPGETLFVNAAAGATGNLVGQIGKILGCRVVGCAGSDEKVAYLKEIGFDGVFNYKTVENYSATLKELCPNGIDCFFENVGDRFEVVLQQMNKYGRIALCGHIASYNVKENETPQGPLVHIYAIGKELKIQGFLAGTYAAKFPQMIEQLVNWVKEDKIVVREQIKEGFENTPKALISLFTGDNIGKCSVKVK